MIDGLERALRDEFALRATEIPASADIADLVIVRAKKTRRRRRVMAAGAACVTMVLAGATAVWATDLVTGAEQPPASTGEVQTRDDGLSTLVDVGEGVDIANSDGSIVDSGLAQVYSATQVDGGWLAYGTTTDIKDKARYVSFSGDWQDLGEGEVMSIYPNERGDAAVVESYVGDGEYTVGTIYEFDAKGAADPIDSQEIPGSYTIDGMAGENVWMIDSSGSETNLGTWSAGTRMKEMTTATPVEPLAAVADGMVFADISSSGETFCPAVVDPVAGFDITTKGDCYDNQVVFPDEVSISPDGRQALVYMQPYVDADTAGGEWNWLDLTMNDGLVPTGQTVEIRPVINRDGEAVFAEPDHQYLSFEIPDVIPHPSAR